jgi:hypothetical protein
VANLAEIAANEIGANALLLRVGAYYHDIGKMFKPNYFVENIQMQGENPHDRMPPFASAKILKSHIVLGMEVGKRFGLPRKVLDLIPQHHGTTVMDYFYEKAKTNPQTVHISERYFAYPGPRPRSKEAAILMIVDSVEAASRVLSDHSEETVRKMIEKLINHKLEQRQLDEAVLTLAELRRIVYALTKALSTSTHKRIDYPEESGINRQFGVNAGTAQNGSAQPPAPAAAGTAPPANGTPTNGGDSADPPAPANGPSTQSGRFPAAAPVESGGGKRKNNK